MKPDLTFPMAFDKACTAELATLYISDMPKSQSPPKPKGIAIHYSEADPQDDSDGEEDIHCLNEVRKKSWPIYSSPPQTECKGCRGNHPRAACNYKDAICHRCSQKGNLTHVCRSAQLPKGPLNRQAFDRYTPKRPYRNQDGCYAIFHELTEGQSSD